MKHFNSIYFWAIVSAVILFKAGQLLFTEAFTIFEPQIDGISFQIIEQSRFIKTAVLFSMSLAIIPLLVIYTWRLTRISSWQKRLISSILIFIFIILGILARHQQVKIYFNKVVRPALLINGRTSYLYRIDPVIFVYYIFSGLIIGCIVSYFFFRTKVRES